MGFPTLRRFREAQTCLFTPHDLNSEGRLQTLLHMLGSNFLSQDLTSEYCLAEAKLGHALHKKIRELLGILLPLSDRNNISVAVKKTPGSDPS